MAASTLTAVPAEYCWEAAAPLPDFDRFGSEELREFARRQCPDQTDQYRVVVTTSPSAPIPPACVQSWEYFRAHEPAICRDVLESILRHYLVQRPQLLEELDPDSLDTCVPEISTVDGLVPLIAFHTLHVHPATNEGTEGPLLQADVGFEFECAWEVEHGLGVRVFGGRVVRVGHADDAFDSRERSLWSIANMGDGMQTG